MMEHGRIVETGTHHGLLAVHRRCADLWHSQFAGKLLQQAETAS